MASTGLELLWMLMSSVLLVSNWQYWTYGSISMPQVPCLFIFGDSVFDNGNNMYLNTPVKASYLPYGMDFAYGGTTGRCSNGVNIADVIADQLGFDSYIPYFGLASCKEILNGVNYASSGGGILNKTGEFLGELFTMDMQLYNHKIITARIAKKLGCAYVAKKYLSQCIYAVNIGGNDYFNNYYSSDYNTSKIYNPEQFAELLIQTYEIQLEKLCDGGARKIAAFGLARMGCMPAYIEIFGADESLCNDKINDAVQIFNKKLQNMLLQLSARLPGAIFTYINSYQIDSENFTDQGFKVINKSCCTRTSGEVPCQPLTAPCADRSEYVYWDGAHFTEARAWVFGKRAYKRQSLEDAYPHDISELARLSIDVKDDCQGRMHGARKITNEKRSSHYLL